jgi:simple sugar transport system permease protein
MNTALALLEDAAFWEAVLARSAPFIIGVMGALLCARAGALHLGIEGILALGALGGIVAAQHGIDPWTGVLAAGCIGLIAGGVQAVLIGPLGASQPLAGLALTLAGASVALAAWPADAAPEVFFRPLDVPFLSEMPNVGAALFRQTPPFYLAILLALILAYVLNRTPLGLAIRGCGENPVAVEVQGRSVHRLRSGAIMAGSAMIAAAGAAITLMAAQFVPFGQVAGRGFLCLALAAAAGWRPGFAFAGALAFGAIEAASPRLQQDFGLRAPLMAMVPYLLAIAALVATRRRLRWPSALIAPSRNGGAP